LCELHHGEALLFYRCMDASFISIVVLTKSDAHFIEWNRSRQLYS